MNIPAGLIPRDHYMKNFEPFINQSLIKVLTGQRRVGKSYLLYQLMQQIQLRVPEAQVIYINKEDFAFDGIRNAADLNRFVLENTRENVKNYLFIDEIQDIEDFERAIRSFLLNDQYDIYITGSNANLLSGELATYLGGRFVEFRIYSLSYLEFLMFQNLENNHNSLISYLRYGGMPYLHRLKQEDDIVFEYLNSLVNTIIYKDVVTRFGVRNTRFLDQLVRFLAEHTGSMFSSKSISDFLKSQLINMAPNQVQTYAGYLCNAFLIQRSDRYDLEGKRIFETGEKYYFENLGLRNAIAGFKPSDMNQLVENAVYNHLCFHGYDVKTGQSGKQEIDFVAEKHHELVYIQAALRLDSQKTIDREFGNLQKVSDHYPKLVVSLDDFTGNSIEGVRHVGLKDFLTNFQAQ